MLELIKSRFFREYIENVIEAFIILIIIRAIVDKPIDYIGVLKASVIIGLLVSFATTVNEDFRSNVRQGLHFGVSGIILSQFSPVVM